MGKGEVAIHGGDAAHRGAKPAPRIDDAVAWPDAPRGNRAGIAAEVAVAQHELHRHAERRIVTPAVEI